jgi:hypothetical protein
MSKHLMDRLSFLRQKTERTLVMFCCGPAADRRATYVRTLGNICPCHRSNFEDEDRRRATARWKLAH